jgi:hypothetical protein
LSMRHGVTMAYIVERFTAFTVATLGGWAQVFHAVRQTKCCKETKDKDMRSSVPNVSLGAWAHGSLAVVTFDGYT